MNRRGFLGMIAAAVGAGVVGIDLEQLWELEPAKTILLPVPQGILLRQAELVINPPLFIPELWSREILAVYKNSLVLANHINRQAGMIHWAPRVRPVGSFAKFDAIAAELAHV